MRALITEIIQDTDTGTLTLSQEFPYTADGTVLYVKNLRKIYVDVMQTTRNQFIATLDNSGVNSLTNTIKLYFAQEARNSESYEPQVQDLLNIKDHAQIRALGYHSRNSSAVTEYVDNILITTIEYEFTKLT